MKPWRLVLISTCVSSLRMMTLFKNPLPSSSSLFTTTPISKTSNQHNTCRLHPPPLLSCHILLLLATLSHHDTSIPPMLRVFYCYKGNTLSRQKHYIRTVWGSFCCKETILLLADRHVLKPWQPWDMVWMELKWLFSRDVSKFLCKTVFMLIFYTSYTKRARLTCQCYWKFLCQCRKGTMNYTILAVLSYWFITFSE